MGKNKDLFQILSIILIGMFFPLLGALILTFGLDLTNLGDLLKIVLAFLYFLAFFGLELLVIYVYFTLSNKIANKKMDEYKPK